MAWQPFRYEPADFENLGRGHRWHLPAGGQLELATGHHPHRSGGQHVGTGVLWARLTIPVNRSMGNYYPHTDWFRWQPHKADVQVRAMIEQSGGFLSSIPGLLAAYWEAYALELEDKLREATQFLESSREDYDPEDEPDGPVGMLDGYDEQYDELDGDDPRMEVPVEDDVDDW